MTPLPDRILFFLLCSLVFVLPVTNAGVEIASALGIIVLFWKWRASGLLRWCEGLPSRRVFLPLMLLLAWSLLSVLWSQNQLSSLKGFVGKSLQSVFLFLIAYGSVTSLKRIRILITVLLVSAGIIGLDSLGQYFWGNDFFVQASMSLGRVTASFKHPNDLGTYLLVMILPTLALVFIEGEKFFKVRSFRRGFHLLGWSIFLGVLAAAMGLTYSRGAWIATLAAFLVFMYFACRLRLILLACGIVFGIIFLPLLAQDRQVSFFSDVIGAPYTLGGSGRLVFWNDALRIIRDYPILGTGLNTYTLVIKDYADTWKAYPHNCYLQMAAELGFVGLAFFLWLLGVVALQVSRQILSMPQQPLRWIGAAFFASWWGVLVHSGLDTTLYSSKLAALFWVLTGSLLGFCKLQEGCIDGKK